MYSVVERASSRMPHSVAKGPPEWSHETCSPSPDRKGSGCLCDRRVRCPSSETGKAYMPPGDLPINALPTHEVLSSLGTELPRVHFRRVRIQLALGGGKCSKRDGNPSPKVNCRKREFGNQGRKHRIEHDTHARTPMSSQPSYSEGGCERR